MELILPELIILDLLAVGQDVKGRSKVRKIFRLMGSIAGIAQYGNAFLAIEETVTDCAIGNTFSFFFL